MDSLSRPATMEETRTEVVVVGAGMVGLLAALGLAKRGMDVTVIDDVVNQKPSYKVGESFLVSTGVPRIIGELDEFLNDECFVKLGVWFTYGVQGQREFRPKSEWVVAAMSEFTLREMPNDFRDHYLYKSAKNKLAFRALVVDQQICRPDTEDLLRKSVYSRHNIRFLDAARVTGVEIAQTDTDAHLVTWTDHSAKTQGSVHARWVIDCSGRTRMLASKLGHRAESRVLNDGFQTTALWGQFAGITDEMFEPVWRYTTEDGTSTRRDLYTLHLWGDGHWIWVIRLSGGRVSVGITYDQKKLPKNGDPKDRFFAALAEYPVFNGVLGRENLLEFRMYRNVQHVTDTFVHSRRYAMLGDASSIIDAYYSQGLGQSFQTMWHVSNIIEKDLRRACLDTGYIDRVNKATFEDWLTIRSFVQEKYSGAIADPRFFLLSHMLDWAVIWSTGTARYRWTNWLAATGGDTSKEDETSRKHREFCEARLFYSRGQLGHWMSEQAFRRRVERFQAKLGERARWRLEHGITGPSVFCQLSLTRCLPRGTWRLLGKPSSAQVEISGPDFVAPRKLRKPWARSWVNALPLTASQRFSLVLNLRAPLLATLFLTCYALDAADTARLKALHRLGGGRRQARTES
ncbi:NAD(P)/FAD-dependent oxidoreductase [Frankia sp. Cas3]|uniref:NAD(P)/FAD-dependent oxidoreductase n=1 Tax=Frankia sp. Cas3 TaxID=3073926 RepID=UPI002AD211D3|nr:FAD-dependent monooxygenase [Frankia sp. Cas3]